MHMGRWQELSQEDHQVLREDVSLPPASTILSVDPISGAAKKTARPGGPGKRPAKGRNKNPGRASRKPHPRNKR